MNLDVVRVFETSYAALISQENHKGSLFIAGCQYGEDLFLTLDWNNGDWKSVQKLDLGDKFGGLEVSGIGNFLYVETWLSLLGNQPSGTTVKKPTYEDVMTGPTTLENTFVKRENLS